MSNMWVRQYLILLDQRKLVTFEEGCASIDCIGGASVQLCGLPLVDGSVASLLKLRRQEVVKVVALNLLSKTKPDAQIRIKLQQLLYKDAGRVAQRSSLQLAFLQHPPCSIHLLDCLLQVTLLQLARHYFDHKRVRLLGIK